MKTTMLLAGALALSFAGGAAAKDAHGVSVHKTHKAKTLRAARQPAMPPPRDPYAAYWNDPSRNGPFSWGGHDVK
ncbi:MAG: hypothetical protein E6G97_00805 [Alphaproteobacteria bacterium]|nr:MAG: hypothetical protein E6G97_00805 [Alphaproteobacteria bacterium]